MKKYCIILLWLFFATLSFAQKKQNLDSLEQISQKMPNDTSKVKLLAEIAWKYRSKNAEKAIILNQEAINLCKKLNHTQILPKLLNQAAVFTELLAKYPESLNFAFQVLKTSGIQSNKRELGYAYNNIANINFRLSDYSQAMEYALKAFNSFATIKDSTGLGYSSLRYAEAAMMLNDYNKTYQYAQISLDIRKKLSDSSGVNVAYVVLGRMLKKQEKYKEALVYLEKVLSQNRHNERALLNSLNALTSIYILQNNQSLAKKYALMAMQLTDKTTAKLQIKDTYENMADVYYAEQNYDSAFKYQNLFVIHKKGIHDEEKNILASSLTHRYQNEEELERMNVLETEAGRNKIIIYGSGIVLLLVIFLLAFVIRNNIRQQEENKSLLNQQTNLTEKGSMINNLITELDKKNDHIIASIQYAKRIQDAVLISKENLIKLFPINFIIFKPKDIVSGDFYWAAEKKFINNNSLEISNTMIAVGDCTGHGVPGGFMTLIACSLLDQIVHEKEIHRPDLVLSNLHKAIRFLLRPDETDNNDSIDLSFCYFDSEKEEVLFAGATQSLLYINENHELQTIKGDKKALGGVLQDIEQSFKLHYLKIPKNAMIYLATDGYADQFGGEAHKRFSSKTFKILLESIHEKSVDEQSEVLKITFSKWLGAKYQQMDDITILGLRDFF